MQFHAVFLYLFKLPVNPLKQRYQRKLERMRQYHLCHM